MTQEVVFETRSQHPFRCLVSLGGARVLSIFGNTAMLSTDGGRSWDAPYTVRARDSSPAAASPEAQTDVGSLAALPGGLISVIRLANGELGGIQRLPVRLPREYRHVGRGRLCFVVSSDEGRTWEPRGDVSLPVDNVEGIHALLELRSGRLLYPAYWFVSDYAHPEYRGSGSELGNFRGGYGTYEGRRMLVEGHGHTPEFGGVMVFYSDDHGVTWQTGPNNLWIWPLPAEADWGGHGALYEPCAIELTDGRVRLYARSLLGQLYEAISTDGGYSWGIPRPTGLVSSDSPCAVARLPATGHLLMVWNQLSGNEIMRGLKRCRLSCAVSPDDGDTWQHFRTLVHAGVPAVGRLEPGPLRHYHALENVGQIPFDFGVFDYPGIGFAGDLALVGYGAHAMRPMAEWRDDTPVYGLRDMHHRLKAVSMAWIYES
jgi:hypothetical protein